MKRTLSMILAVMFVLTSFGVVTLFSGVISAGAVFYDYYDYTDFPGLTAFTSDELNTTFMKYVTPAGQTTVDGVGKVQQYTVTGKGVYNEVEFATSVFRNETVNKEGKAIDFIWGAHSNPGGKDMFNGTDLSFADATGFCVYIAINGQPYTQNLKIRMFHSPCKGPYFQGTDDGKEDLYEDDVTTGCVYECSGKRPDEDGYVYYDFKTDFQQCDWWSKDDNGESQYGKGITPIPEGNLAMINDIEFLVFYPEVGDVIQIGGFKVYKDKRIHTDELVEYMDVFDALDPEAYTEESYSEATEVYLKAYDIANDPDSFTQKEVDAMAKELRNAINALDPMFHARDKEVTLAGFEVWDDDDFDIMTSGEICIDTPAIEEDNVPANKDQSVIIMGNAQEGPPSYGWSIFSSSVYNEDSEIEAVKNPFELVGDSKPMSETSGIRFWVKWDESLSPVPQSMRVGVGSAASQVLFECEETALTLPTEEEGSKYVGIPWSAFWDVEGEEDIFDYIDELDYITIYLEGCTGAYYIGDLHCFMWSMSEADMDALREAIIQQKNYVATLDENEYFPRSWLNMEMALAQAEALVGQYGVTEQEADEAIENLNKAISRLTPLGDVAPIDMLNKIEILIKGAKTYWRGNVTPASYRELKLAVDEADEIMNATAPKTDEAQRLIDNLTDKISKLQPIKAGTKVTSVFSFENYTSRDLNRATGDRTEGVIYTLDKEYSKLPAGYSQALKMEATQNMGSENTDEHGMMQYKAMYREKGSNSVVPIKLGPANENLLMGDLTGTDGLCFWIGVNDVNLVQQCTLRFAVSNCTISPLFEMAAIEIPLPTTGSGWMYIPWEYFEYYDDWTHGQPIDLAKIYFYIFRFDGSIKAGLETYITGLHAYKDVNTTTWDAPVISNIKDNDTIDLSTTGSFIPDWNLGFASLNGKYFVYGQEITENGSYDLEVMNGDKSTKVHFDVTGGIEVKDEVPEVSGVAEGDEIDLATDDAPVISWTVGTATLNGDPITKGTAVSEVGEYTLVVTNGLEQVTVHFTVKDTTPPPPPATTLGDFDNDGEITVADALAALRIAAKLVEEDENNIAVGDIDKDGHVTVADALAILRVAAKLTDKL